MGGAGAWCPAGAGAADTGPFGEVLRRRRAEGGCIAAAEVVERPLARRQRREVQRGVRIVEAEFEQALARDAGREVGEALALAVGAEPLTQLGAPAGSASRMASRARS